MANLSSFKWGAPAFGTSGGVVTWSIVNAGVGGVISGYDTLGDPARGDDRTVDAQAATGFEITAALRQSFAAWSDVADINFVQVRDGGGEVLKGPTADIRVALGYIDGERGSILGKAFFPNENVRGGDILIDADEFTSAASRSKFLAVAAHEIGHSIGLRHTNNIGVLMNPIITDIKKPQDDDIAGVQEKYGAVRDAPLVLRLKATGPDVQLVQRINDLKIIGTGGDNQIIGAAGAEEMRGLAGDDFLSGKAGADRIFGAAGADSLLGGGGEDSLVGGGGGDEISGGGRNDLLKGGGGADLLFGGGGDDELLGNGGADTLDGGRGADTLKGGGGADVFVFSSGADTIIGFDLSQDRINAAFAADLSSVTIETSEAGAVVSGNGRSLILSEIEATALSEGNFLFAGQGEAAPIAAQAPPEPPIGQDATTDAELFGAAPAEEDHEPLIPHPEFEPEEDDDHVEVAFDGGELGGNLLL